MRAIGFVALTVMVVLAGCGTDEDGLEEEAARDSGVEVDALKESPVVRSDMSRVPDAAPPPDARAPDTAPLALDGGRLGPDAAPVLEPDASPAVDAVAHDTKPPVVLFSVSPGILHFSENAVGGSANLAVFLLNQTPDTVFVEIAATIAGQDAADFRVEKNSCTTIGYQRGCQIVAQFAPKTPGDKNALLVVTIASDRGGTGRGQIMMSGFARP